MFAIPFHTSRSHRRPDQADVQGRGTQPTAPPPIDGQWAAHRIRRRPQRRLSQDRDAGSADADP